MKRKDIFFAQFWSKSENSISEWWKNVQNLKDKYCHRIFVKNVTFIGKKHAQFFLLGLGTLWKWNLKFTNICRNLFIVLNIWCTVLRLVFKSSLNSIHIRPAACLNWSWFYCKFFFCCWLYSTSPQIYIKSETGQRTTSNYFVWNNYIRKKWVLWWKYSYFPFSVEPDT